MPRPFLVFPILVLACGACSNRPDEGTPPSRATKGPPAGAEGVRPAPDPEPFEPPDAATPEDEPRGKDDAPPELRSRILAFAAEELAASLGECTLRRLERIEWPDSSLGCSEPGEISLPVVTPGYRAEVESPSGTHYVHSDLEGRRMLLCKREE